MTPGINLTEETCFLSKTHVSKMTTACKCHEVDVLCVYTLFYCLILAEICLERGAECWELLPASLH